MATASVLTAPQGGFVKFFEFSKLVESDEGGSSTVYGIATWERPDSDEEICDYDAAVPIYQSWSQKAFRRTKKAGQEISLGNVRLMHGAQVGGKVTQIDFRDDEKEIAVGSEPANDDVYQQLKKGMLTGYSQGGSYAWRECENCKTALPLQQGNNYCPNCDKNVLVRYGLKRLAEISYVDSPAIGEGFEHVKAGGSREIIKFQKHKEASVSKTKRVAGADLTAECFAFVGDPQKTATWKLPIKFPNDEEKTKSHIRNALSRFEQTEGIPEDKKAEVKAKIHAAAVTHGIDVAIEHGKNAKLRDLAKAHIDSASQGVTKNLWDVARAADLLQSIACLWEGSVWEREIEGDDSEVPDELKELLDGFVETFIAMAEEEARELAARNNKKTTGDAMTPEELELQKAAKKSLAAHFAKKAAHHEKMADIHEAIAEGHETKADHHEKAMGGCEECMGKAVAAQAKKADTDPDDEQGASVQSILSNQMTFHKGMMAEEKGHAADHMKLAKAHDKIAEHYGKMAEASDESSDKAETAAVLKAEREANTAELAAETTVKKTEAVPPTMEADIAAAAARKRDTPEYKAQIDDIAQKLVDAEVAKKRETTLAPLGTLVDGNKAEPGKVAAVPRTEDTTAKLASRPGSNSVAGM